MQPLGQLFAGLRDGLPDVGVQIAERRVGACAGQFDQRHGADQAGRAGLAGEREIDQGAGGMDAVKRVGGDLKFAE